MRVLGVDPGTAVTGYGVIDAPHNVLSLVESGSIASPSTTSLPTKLKHIYAELIDVMSQCRPDVLAIEDVFFAKNVKSALTLGHARGIILLAAEYAGLQIHTYSPLEVKQSVVGYGRAAKSQVQTMVRHLLKSAEIENVHAADALAVAICHVHTARWKDMVAEATTDCTAKT